MTQEEKDLLLKDICSRLPHGVKCEVIKRRIDGEIVYVRNGSVALELTINNFKELVTDNLYDIKPYLFPLSSMTEEQEKEWRYTLSSDGNITYDTVDWCNENHFDYRGLIPMGLAIDAIGLNIY